MQIRFLGSSGTRPLLKRPLASAIVHINDSKILLDCGEGTQVSLQMVKAKFSKISIICLTHLHLDHILGIPSLLATMSNYKRKEDLLIIGPEGTRKCIQSLLVPLVHLEFRINYFELPETEVNLDFDTFSIKAFRVEHSIPCYGYRIEQYTAPRFNADVIENSSISSVLWTAMYRGATLEVDGELVNRNTYFGADRPTRSIVYCVDTRPCATLQRYSKDADLLVLEAMYFNNERDLAEVNKHMMLQESISVFKHSGAKELVVTHFSPSATNTNTNDAICAYAGLIVDVEETVKVNCKEGKDA